MRLSPPWLGLCVACSSPELAVQEVVDRPLVRVVHAERPDGALHCVDTEDPDDPPLVLPVGRQTFHVVGLHGDRRHVCTWRRGAREVELELETAPLPSVLGELRAEGVRREGWTAVNLWSRTDDLPAGQHLVLLDPDGEVVGWVPLGTMAPAVDIAQDPDGTLVVGGGPELQPRWLDALGRVSATAGPSPGGYHHHAQPLGDGTVLALVLEEVADPAAPMDPWEGFAIHQLDASDVPLWSWSSQDAWAAGDLPPRASGRSDPWHANSVSLDDDGAIWQNLAWPGQILRIDPVSGAVTDVFGAGGTLELLDGSWPAVTHDPEWEGDRVLLYDNGTSATGSRLVEYQVDLAAGTARQVWEWTEPGWYEPLFGDADRTPEGTVLASRGRCWEDRGCAGFEANPDRRSSLVEIDPSDGAVPWRVDFPTTEHSVYRAERVDRCALLGGCLPPWEPR